MEVLIYFDEEKYNHQKQAYESFLPMLQDAVNKFNSLDLEPLKQEELKRLITDTKAFLFDKITKGNTLSIAGIEIDKIKAFEIIKMPEGCNELLEKVSNIIVALKNIDFHDVQPITASAIDGFYMLDENGIVCLKENKVEQLKKQNSEYATSERAKKMLAFANTFLQAVKDYQIGIEFLNNPDGVTGVMKTLFETRNENPFCINTKRIMEYNNENAVVRA